MSKVLIEVSQAKIRPRSDAGYRAGSQVQIPEAGLIKTGSCAKQIPGKLSIQKDTSNYSIVKSSPVTLVQRLSSEQDNFSFR